MVESTLWKGVKQQGFTVIELVVTLSIAAILIMMATPSLRSSINEHRALAMVSALKADLEFARNHAISTNQTIKVRVDNKTNCIWSTWVYDAPSAGYGSQVLAHAMTTAELANYNGVKCAFTFTGSKSATFNGLGLNISGSSFTVVVSASADVGARKWLLTLQTSGNLKVVAQ
jgi:type IV fimbrial biogenesis protein FimT